MKRFSLFLLLILSFQLLAQKTIPLYASEIPNSTKYPMKEIQLELDGKFFGYCNISKLTLVVYLPDQKTATGTAVIICPGGAYAMESYLLEGTSIAKEFLKNGIAAFVLKYRLPSDSIMKVKSIGPLQDAQQAIKTVSQQAIE